MSYHFPKIPLPADIALSDWQDWMWQNRQSLTQFDDYIKWFSNTSHFNQEDFEQTKPYFKSRTTPYYGSLIRWENPKDPLRLMTVPQQQEASPSQWAFSDPLGEKKHQPTPLLIHRYPDRVIFLTTSICATYCRYCFRKHHTAQAEPQKNYKHYEESLTYLKKTKKIKEVILSGGDPLSLSDTKLLKILNDLRSIPHIDIIRIGTKFAAVNPFRFTVSLVEALSSFQPLYFMHHFNHPNEITHDTQVTLHRLAQNGLMQMNQTVLLNGVNNHPALLAALNRRLLYLSVKPYYLFQCDPSQGTEHFIHPLKESLQIYQELWGRLSGLALPKFSLDIPLGGGKYYFSPQHAGDSIDTHIQLTGFDGVSGEYRSPVKAIPPYIDPLYQKEWQETLDED